MSIHPTAIINSTAKIGSNVEIGPFVSIGPNVEIASNTIIQRNVVIEGYTTIGESCNIYPYVSIGLAPQDISYKDEPTKVVIGNNNIIREFVTIHRGTPHSNHKTTTLGNHAFIMVSCHIGHDCNVGDHVIMANGSSLGGHVMVKDRVFMGAFTAVHQFCSIGSYVITGGQTAIAQDILPYLRVVGNRVKVNGINKIGLQRNGFSAESIRNIEKAYKIFFRQNLRQEDAIQKLQTDFSNVPEIQYFIEFIQKSKRGICR